MASNQERHIFSPESDSSPYAQHVSADRFVTEIDQVLSEATQNLADAREAIRPPTDELVKVLIQAAHEHHKASAAILALEEIVVS